MDAVKYLKYRNKMCEMYKCTECPIYEYADSYSCDEVNIEKLEKVVDIVEKWAKEHPGKTRQSEFLKLFPNTEVDESNIILICPEHVDKNFACRTDKGCKADKMSCDECRKDFWLEELE